MIDTVLRLVDRCIDLAKRRQEADKATYSSFVTPAIQDFDLVHKDYLVSFRKYREMIAETKDTFDSRHPVLDAIRTDSLFSGDLRSKLYALHSLSNDPVVGRLIGAIDSYLKGAANDHIRGYWTEDDRHFDDLQSRGIANSVRTAYSNGIQNIFEGWLEDDKLKQKRAIEALDILVGQLQERYSIVMREHLLLKQRLLTETKL